MALLQTKSSQIDALYRRFNTTFEEEDRFFDYLEFGLERGLAEIALGERELARGYMFQTIVAILIDRHFNLGLVDRAVETAPEVAAAIQLRPADLAALIDGLRDPERYPSLNEFVEATKGTNVGRAKAVRFLFLGAAI